MSGVATARAPAATAGGYRLVADVPRGLLIVTLSGFLSPEAARAFHVERRSVIARLGLAPNAHVALCDIRECLLQSRDTADVFGRVMADPSLVARKLAFVTGSSLAWMQVRRIMATRPGIACFDTIAEAEAWLFADG